MKKSVKVAIHPETKAVITKNENKPEYGTIRLDMDVISMENGFLNKSKRSAFLAGKLADLQALELSEGQEFPGQIVRTESFAPQFEGQAPKINPTTQDAVLIDGKNVYFQDTYTEDLSAKDSLLKSTSVKTAVVSVGANEHSVD